VLPIPRIAVDIVLLPEPAIMDLAIAANAELVKKSRLGVGLITKHLHPRSSARQAHREEQIKTPSRSWVGSEIVLDKNDCIPHISLAMGCVNRGDIARISGLLQPLAASAPKNLRMVGIQKSTSFSGEIVSVLQVERATPLQKLHEEICEMVRPFFAYDAVENMVAGGRAGQTTLQWIKDYPAKSSYDSFSPHITVGYGDLPDRVLPVDFAVSRLAICHLGNHCTCAKVLWSMEI